LQPVFVARDGMLSRRSVRIGLCGYERVEILDGLRDGDTIVLSDMQDYVHLNSVRLSGRALPDSQGVGR
jgi:HlyD family secretion protein